MSVKSLVWAWSLSIKIASHKLVMLALADNSNDQGECFPKLETIAHKSGLTIRALQKILNKLKEQNLINIESRFRQDGRQTSNIYSLNLVDNLDKNEKNMISTPSYRTSSPRPTGHPHPVLQGVPPLQKSDISNNKNNILQQTEFCQLKGLTNTITKSNDDSVDNFLFTEWLSKEMWDEYKQHRKELKKPLTKLAEIKALSKLTKFHQQGYDVKEIINQSILNGWVGLFETKINALSKEILPPSATTLHKEIKYSTNRNLTNYNQIRSTVTEWGPNHPSYRSLKGLPPLNEVQKTSPPQNIPMKVNNYADKIFNR